MISKADMAKTSTNIASQEQASSINVKLCDLAKVISEHEGVELFSCMITSTPRDFLDNDAFALDLRMCAEQKKKMNTMLLLCYNAKEDGYNKTTQTKYYPCQLDINQIGNRVFDLYYYRIVTTPKHVMYKFEQPEMQYARVTFRAHQMNENNVLGHALKKIVTDRTKSSSGKTNHRVSGVYESK